MSRWTAVGQYDQHQSSSNWRLLRFAPFDGNDYRMVHGSRQGSCASGLATSWDVFTARAPITSQSIFPEMLNYAAASSHLATCFFSGASNPTRDPEGRRSGCWTAAWCRMAKRNSNDDWRQSERHLLGGVHHTARSTLQPPEDCGQPGQQSVSSWCSWCVSSVRRQSMAA